MCSLWVRRWVERQLRENRGEARMVPTSFAETRSRSNEFISKVKDVNGVGKKGETRAAPRTYETREPARDSFERLSRQPLHAASLCQSMPAPKVAEPAWAIISRPYASGRQAVTRPSSLLSLLTTETERKRERHRERERMRERERESERERER